MKIKGMRWVIIALIFLATVVNYIDRSALGIMWGSEDLDGSISQSLGMTKSDYGLILNIFMVSYAIGQLLCGRIFDKIGTRMGYVLSIAIWGGATILHAFSRGVISLGVFRSILGVSEAGNWPGAVKSNAEWFPVKERAVAQGIFNAGASIGSVISPPLIAALFIAFGWQWTFAIVGSLAFVWVIPWLAINKAGPADHPWVTDEERKYILADQTTPNADTGSGKADKKGLTIRQILSHKEAWAVVVARFFLEPIWWLFVGWMPIYLFDVYNFNVKEVGMFTWVPYVGAALGSIVGGVVSGKIISATGSVNKGRKVTILIGGIFMVAGLAATIFFGNTALRFVLIVFMVLFGFQFAIGNIQTLPSDLFSGKSVGSLAGLGGMVGVFSVIIMNMIVPKIAAISYQPIFIGIAVFVPLGVAAVYFLAKDIRSVEEA